MNGSRKRLKHLPLMIPGRGDLTVAREKFSVTKVTLVLTTMDWTMDRDLD